MHYFDTRNTNVVRDFRTNKLHRISVRNGVPYVTYKRATRILFSSFPRDSRFVGGYINYLGQTVYFK